MGIMFLKEDSGLKLFLCGTGNWHTVVEAVSQTEACKIAMNNAISIGDESIDVSAVFSVREIKTSVEDEDTLILTDKILDLAEFPEKASALREIISNLGKIN